MAGQDTKEQAGPSKHYHPCTNGTRHWGPDGAAGMLCWSKAQDGRPFVLLAKRSRHVQQGGTWAFPGGAVDSPESPLDAAIRELSEEIDGITPDSMTAVVEAPCQEGCGWQYTTFVVRSLPDPARRNHLPRPRIARGPSAWETDVVAWIPATHVDQLNLHPAFAAAWPAIRELVEGAA